MIDRMVYNHRNDEDSSFCDRLALLENIPRKEKKFVSYVAEFCHISEEKSKELWDEMENLEQELLMDKRSYRTDKVSS